MAYCRVGGTTHVPVQTLNILKDVAVIFITSTIVWPQVKKQGGNTGLPIKRIGLRFSEHGPTHQNKTQFPPQSVSPIRKLP